MIDTIITYALQTITIAFVIAVTLIVLAAVLKATVRSLKYFLKTKIHNYRKFKFW